MYRSFGAASSASMFEPAVSSSSASYTKGAATTSTAFAGLPAASAHDDVEFDDSDPDLATVSWRSLAAGAAAPGGALSGGVSGVGVPASIGHGHKAGGATMRGLSAASGAAAGAPSALYSEAEAVPDALQAHASPSSSSSPPPSLPASNGSFGLAFGLHPAPPVHTTAFSDAPMGAPPPDSASPPTFDAAWRNMSQIHFAAARPGGDAAAAAAAAALGVLRSVRAALGRCNCREWCGAVAGARAPFSWSAQAIYGMPGHEVMQCTAGVYVVDGSLTVIFQHVSGSIDVFNRVAHTVAQQCDGVEDYPL